MGSKVTSFAHMFQYASSFNQDIGGWNVSACRSFYGMFDHATSFNQDIEGWDVSAGTSFDRMFDGATSFHQDLTSWPSNAKDDKYFCNDGAICNHSLKKTTNWALIDSLTVVSIALLGIFFYYEFHYCNQNDSAQCHEQ